MTIQAEKMCFGLTEELDRQSFVCFLQLAGNREFAETLARRVTREEIMTFVDSFTDLLRQYLSEEEYHSLFLQDASHHHTTNNTGA